MNKLPKAKVKNQIPQPKQKISYNKENKEEITNSKLYQRKLKFNDSIRHFGKDITSNVNNNLISKETNIISFSKMSSFNNNAENSKVYIKKSSLGNQANTKNSKYVDPNLEELNNNFKNEILINKNIQHQYTNSLKYVNHEDGSKLRNSVSYGKAANSNNVNNNNNNNLDNHTSIDNIVKTEHTNFNYNNLSIHNKDLLNKFKDFQKSLKNDITYRRNIINKKENKENIIPNLYNNEKKDLHENSKTHEGFNKIKKTNTSVAQSINNNINNNTNNSNAFNKKSGNKDTKSTCSPVNKDKNIDRSRSYKPGHSNIPKEGSNLLNKNTIPNNTSLASKNMNKTNYFNNINNTKAPSNKTNKVIKHKNNSISGYYINTKASTNIQANTVNNTNNYICNNINNNITVNINNNINANNNINSNSNNIIIPESHTHVPKNLSKSSANIIKDTYKSIESQHKEASNQKSSEIKSTKISKQKEINEEYLQKDPMLKYENKYFKNLDSVFPTENIQIPVEYMNIIYHNLLIEENIGIDPKAEYNYMTKQKEINEQMRSILIDWLIDVHFKFGFTDETLFMTISIIDRYLTQKQVTRANLQLLGITALLIACKHEEIDLPKIKDFIYITDNAYNRDDVYNMENDIFLTLKFNLLFPSPIKFFEYLALYFKFNKKEYFMGKYLMESFLIDIKNTKYRSSTISCACAYIVMKFFKMKNYNQSYKSIYYSFNEEELNELENMIRIRDNDNNFVLNKQILNEHNIKDCAKDICIFVDNVHKTNFLACQKKYSKPEHENVAMIIVSK